MGGGEEGKEKQEAMEVDLPSQKEGATSSTDEENKAGVATASSQNVDLLTFENLREHCRLIERGEISKEPRFIARVLRSLVTTRKRLNGAVLSRLITVVLASQSREKLRQFLISFLNLPDSQNSMEVDSRPLTSLKSPRPLKKSGTVLPDVEVYIQLLVVFYLFDQSKLEQAEKCCNDLVKRIEVYNRRSLDALAAKVYFYYSLIYEKNGKNQEVRDFLHARLRTATLHHEVESQAVLINCLLRSYLLEKLYGMAGKLVNKVTFPESANNNEWARHYYYLGRIKAVQLEYGAAEKYLEQAIRKAPQHSAVGFKQSVQKCKIVVDLLLGEIPERSLFRQPIYIKSLIPYLQLTQALRIGDVQRFNEVLEKFGSRFEKDGTYWLIVRLRQNVIKTAVRQISLAYSRISIAGAQKKLQLSHPDDAEYIISKVIKDGVIEATLNHNQGFMQSAETADVYGTAEPQHQYHNRIAFCLELYNQAVKAMRFPPKSYSKDIESAEEQREREQQELEFAKEMAEDDDEFP